ncbi:hypothetical protein C0J52_25422 [Blattella germanica]|nr:hypothetical protein C0J52_25422 [Blattella germanica]
MAQEAGSEVVSVIQEHLNKVKQALLSHSNKEKTIKEESLNSVSEMNLSLSKLSGMFEGLEKSLTKALVAAEKENRRSYSEQLATFLSYRRNLPPLSQQPPPPGGDCGNQVAVKLIVKPADPNTFSASDVRKLMKEKIYTKHCILELAE